jgi:hypothetical protein
MKRILFTLVALAMLFGMALPVYASNSQCTVSFGQISGGPGSNPTKNLYTDPISLSGIDSAINPSGSLHTWHVQVDWGDGSVSQAEVAFTATSDGFTGTWAVGNLSSNSAVFPPHYYTYDPNNPANMHTITVTLYHGELPGNDGLGDAQATINIFVSVADHFVFDTISDETAGVPFPITIRAVDAQGNTITSYTGPANLSDLSSSITPTVTGTFSDGNWTGDVGTMANVTAPTTVITMEGNYTIVANFAENGPIIYVNGTAMGSENGTSWYDAYTDLQSALDTAASGEQIWVAAGVYKPTNSTDRSQSFQMIDGVAIYGGFAGNETASSQRDWVTNATTLSGDIGIEGDNSDNCYHVISNTSGIDSTAVLDGFTISRGNATGSDNFADGGGIFNDNSSPTVTNCTFSENTASNWGGGMYNIYQSLPTVTNCSFSRNTASLGGGMANTNSSSMVTNCTFGNNSASAGGGMVNAYSSSPTVTNCTFGNNSAVAGGGIYNEFSSSPTVTNCILWGDTPDEILNDSGSSLIVTYCDVQGGTGQSWFGTGCIDDNPLFTSASDFHLQPGSLCIDAGENSAVPPGITTDLDGNPRIVDGNDDGTATVDMGAYEHPHP